MSKNRQKKNAILNWRPVATRTVMRMSGLLAKQLRDAYSDQFFD